MDGLELSSIVQEVRTQLHPEDLLKDPLALVGRLTPPGISDFNYWIKLQKKITFSGLWIQIFCGACENVMFIVNLAKQGEFNISALYFQMQKITRASF